MKRENSQEFKISNYSIFKNLRLKNQLLILICILIIIVYAFLVCSNYIHTTFLQEFFGKSSSQIYTLYSQNFMKNQLKGYENYFKSLFSSNGQTLITFFQLYTYIRKKTEESNLTTLNSPFIMDFGGINSKIPKSIQSKQIGPYNTTLSSLCYTNKTKFHKPYTHDEFINIKTQESMQAFGDIIFKGNNTFQSFLYAYVKRDNLLMTYPCLQRFDIFNYVPENRSWYKELTRNYQFHQPYNQYNYTLTYPYLLFKSINVGLSMTLPFVDQNLQQIGGASFDLLPDRLFANLIQQLGRDFTLIYLVSMDGIMIMHPYNVTPNQLPLYFYNESITGFNDNDWNILRDYNKSSSCKNYRNSNDYKCLYNSIYNKDMFIQIKNLYSFNISVIVLQSSSEISKFQEQFNYELLEQLNNQFKIQLIELGCLFVLLSLLTYYLTIWLFYPIELIIESTLNQIQKKKYKNRNISNLFGILISVQIMDLYRSYLHFNKLLERLSFHKNEQCQLIEQLQYPKQKIYEFNFNELFHINKLYKLQLKIRQQNSFPFVKSLFNKVIKYKRQR